MFQATDYDKLQQIMEESSEKKELLTRLLESQRMQISTISHEIRNPLSLVYSSLQLIEKEHPEIKLNLMSMTSSDEVIKKTKNMLSVGEVPDLIFTGGYGKDSVYRFMEEKNKAADLMPYLEKLVEYGADCELKDDSGLSALDRIPYKKYRKELERCIEQKQNSDRAVDGMIEAFER